MGDLKSLLKQIGNAQASNGGNWIRDGRYILVLDSMSIESKFAGDTFIAELRVEESFDDPSARAGAVYPATAGEGAPIKANPTGSTVSVVKPLAGNEIARKLAFSAVKAFVLALTEEEDFPDTDEVAATEFVNNLETAIGKDQPLRGAAVKCETFRKWTKDHATLLTLPKWIPVVGQTTETMAARKKALVAAPQ